MKRTFQFCLGVLLLLLQEPGFAQQLKFYHELGGESVNDPFLSMAQDKNGFMWFTTQLNGLQRYDGSALKAYRHDPLNPNSLANNYVECLAIDSENVFWLGTYGSGLDRFDESTRKFTHFTHQPGNDSSLANDYISALLVDRSGNVWVGTLGGLSLLDKQKGTFTNFISDPDNPESLSSNDVRVIYEDRQGTIWIGCGRPFTNLDQNIEDGGLNRYDPVTRKFTRFVHDASRPNSITNNKVRALFEDSRGNFWVGTRGDGLHIMDRKKETFTHFKYDPAHPDKLSRPPQLFENGRPQDHIAFITEDASGSILIGTYSQGVNYFDPASGKVTHYGTLYNENGIDISPDTVSHLNVHRLWRSYIAKDGTIWIETLGGQVLTISPNPETFPHYSINERNPDVNSLYCEPNGNILWIATDEGLFRKNMITNEQKVWKHDIKRNSICGDVVVSIKMGDQGKLWIGTTDGLCSLDTATYIFTTWRHEKDNPKSLSSNVIDYILIDHEKNLWIGTQTTGVDKFEVKKGTFTNYKTNIEDGNNEIRGISEDHDYNIWLATSWGLNFLDRRSGKAHYYLSSLPITSILTDSEGVVWASTSTSLFRFNKASKIFQAYTDANLGEEIRGIVNIVEDKKKNLWVSTKKTIVRIDPSRTAIRKYDERDNVRQNDFLFADNFVGANGEIFLGDQDGFHAFFPDRLQEKNAMFITFDALRIGEIEASYGDNQPLRSPLRDAGEINLKYFQNNFSLEFTAVNYDSKGPKKFLFILENYDQTWHHIGTDRRAYLFNIPPGNYVFRLKAVCPDGTWAEKTIAIVISPPWWKTWWAYSFFTMAFIGTIWGTMSYRSRNLLRSNKLLEDKVSKRTEELIQQKEKVESTLQELKSTQIQLIQSEKMASLGELTAGIAHEIQNPLNFVNNFSELNGELIEEMNQEIDKGNMNEVKAIGKGIKANQEKINHHGKRAEAIVKGMLLHSRSAAGQKELTDINALADEYIRLSYHGLRAKDKSFNATIQTNFDQSIGLVSIIPQDIGRVLLNLFNNAFYAVTEKSKRVSGTGNHNGHEYVPTVSISTRKTGEQIEILVKDNGIGISSNATGKIFQPFFTTKPTGEGTGLGLSLSYEIIKANGGEILVESKENEGAEFTIILTPSS